MGILEKVRAIQQDTTLTYAEKLAAMIAVQRGR